MSAPGATCRRRRGCWRKRRLTAQAAPPEPTETPEPPLSDTIERLYRAVRDELATVEAMRAQRGKLPERPVDAVRTAQTLSSLAETLQKLQRLRCALSPSGSAGDDDMPEDIDAFRFELARRIEAFVASRTGTGDAAPALLSLFCNTREARGAAGLHG